MTERKTGELFEGLESRTMMSAAPLTISQVAYMGGTQLRISGTAADDVISLKNSATGLTINDGAWSTTVKGSFKSLLIDGGAGNDSIKLDVNVKTDAVLYGEAGNDTIIGGSGDDRVYGGDGKDRLAGGAGDDVIVAVGGGSNDAVAGGAGNDSFWVDTNDSITDASASETLTGSHRINAFMANSTASGAAKNVGKEPHGENLADPTMTSTSLSYRNFAGNPLFSDAGPSADDVNQGAIGDCYYLATLASIAKIDPNLIRQSVVELGDGTYAVDFKRGSADAFVRVDADLPTYSWGQVAYAGTGKQGALWVAIMEKAFTYFRNGQGTYQSISAGWMSEAYNALGKSSSNFYSSSSAAWLGTQIKSALVAGNSVTYATTTPNGAPLIGGHAYTVVSVVTDKKGTVTGIRLRNPWGIDGAGNDHCNDGYVTITPAQAQASLLGLSFATV